MAAHVLLDPAGCRGRSRLRGGRNSVVQSHRVSRRSHPDLDCSNVCFPAVVTHAHSRSPLPSPAYRGSVGKNSLRTEGRREVSEVKGESLPGSGTAGAEAGGGGSMGQRGGVWSRGEVCVAGENPLLLDYGGGDSQMMQSLVGQGKAFRVYLESKVRSNQGTGICLNQILRELRKKNL